MSNTIDAGFVPGNYVQNARTKEIHKLNGYVENNNTVMTDKNINLFIKHFIVVETIVCKCKGRLFLGKILFTKDNEEYIECPYCKSFYFFNDGNYVNNNGTVLETYES